MGCPDTSLLGSRVDLCRRVPLAHSHYACRLQCNLVDTDHTYVKRENVKRKNVKLKREKFILKWKMGLFLTT